jgi:hypothetical protein
MYATGAASQKTMRRLRRFRERLFFFRIQMTFKILAAVLLTLGALICLAVPGWQGYVAGAVLLALAVTVFIDSNRWRAWVIPSASLAFAALSATAGLGYLTGESVYLGQSCTGAKRALCELTNTAMVAGGGTLGGLMWLGMACMLVVAACCLRRHYIKAGRP